MATDSMPPLFNLEDHDHLVNLNKGDLQLLIDQMVKSSNEAHRKLDISGLAASVDAFYLLYAGALVFLMQAGFAMLCAGCLREKNIKNIMLKNLLDACVGALGFYAFGYGISYGHAANDDAVTFVGDEWFFLTGDFEKEDSYHGFFFQFAFAATAATIVSGAVAERCQMTAYACYSLFLTAWVYPVVVHCIWSSNGYLSAFRSDGDLINGVGVVDFAGCGVVHMVGGISALVGAAVLGPRSGRFKPNSSSIDDEMPGHNAALVVLGTFMLWFGWYGFNPGSTLCINGCEGVAAKTAVTTTLAAAAGCIFNLGIHKFLSGILSLEEACNGALAGLVGITSACSVVEPWAALLCGVGGAMFYTLGAKLCLKLRIDDPVNASAVHFFAGAWGLFAPALFAHKDNMSNAYSGSTHEGLFYGGTTMIYPQLLALGLVLAWVVANMLPFFIVLKCLGLFRVSLDVEEAGMDASEHGGAAYNIGKK
jgi:Amt family ammonium transporter